LRGQLPRESASSAPLGEPRRPPRRCNGSSRPRRRANQPFLYSQSSPSTRARCPAAGYAAIRYVGLGPVHGALGLPRSCRRLPLPRPGGRGEASTSSRWPQPSAYLWSGTSAYLHARELSSRCPSGRSARCDAAAWSSPRGEIMRSGGALFVPTSGTATTFWLCRPAFPYGWMENPRLTFVTPSVLAATDRALNGARTSWRTLDRQPGHHASATTSGLNEGSPSMSERGS